MLQTEYPFTLPLGYVDAEGNLHKEGVMRLATAFDEIAPLKDPRVQSNPGYLLVILLSRVITRLGTLEHINPKVIEGLYAARSCLSARALRTHQQQRSQPVADAVSALRPALRGGARTLGGIWRYPLERLYEEVAYVAFHFHWPHEEILALEHAERQRWVKEIANINRRLNEQSEKS